MASHKSAEKRARQTVRRTARNASLRSQVKTVVKAFTKVAAAHASVADAGILAAAFTAATREIRRAGTKGVLHRNTVARRVSRLAQANNRALATAPAS